MDTNKNILLIDEEIENLMGVIAITEIDKPAYSKTLDAIERLIEIRTSLMLSLNPQLLHTL